MTDRGGGGDRASKPSRRSRLPSRSNRQHNTTNNNNNNNNNANNSIGSDSKVGGDFGVYSSGGLHKHGSNNGGAARKDRLPPDAARHFSQPALLRTPQPPGTTTYKGPRNKFARTNARKMLQFSVTIESIEHCEILDDGSSAGEKGGHKRSGSVSSVNSGSATDGGGSGAVLLTPESAELLRVKYKLNNAAIELRGDVGAPLVGGGTAKGEMGAGSPAAPAAAVAGPDRKESSSSSSSRRSRTVSLEAGTGGERGRSSGAAGGLSPQVTIPDLRITGSELGAAGSLANGAGSARAASPGVNFDAQAKLRGFTAPSRVSLAHDNVALASFEETLPRFALKFNGTRQNSPAPGGPSVAWKPRKLMLKVLRQSRSSGEETVGRTRLDLAEFAAMAHDDPVAALRNGPAVRRLPVTLESGKARRNLKALVRAHANETREVMQAYARRRERRLREGRPEPTEEPRLPPSPVPTLVVVVQFYWVGVGPLSPSPRASRTPSPRRGDGPDGTPIHADRDAFRMRDSARDLQFSFRGGSDTEDSTAMSYESDFDDDDDFDDYDSDDDSSSQDTDGDGFVVSHGDIGQSFLRGPRREKQSGSGGGSRGSNSARTLVSSELDSLRKQVDSIQEMLSMLVAPSDPSSHGRSPRRSAEPEGNRRHSGSPTGPAKVVKPRSVSREPLSDQAKDAADQQSGPSRPGTPFVRGSRKSSNPAPLKEAGLVARGLAANAPASDAAPFSRGDFGPLPAAPARQDEIIYAEERDAALQRSPSVEHIRVAEAAARKARELEETKGERSRRLSVRNVNMKAVFREIRRKGGSESKRSSPRSSGRGASSFEAPSSDSGTIQSSERRKKPKTSQPKSLRGPPKSKSMAAMIEGQKSSSLRERTRTRRSSISPEIDAPDVDLPSSGEEAGANDGAGGIRVPRDPQREVTFATDVLLDASAGELSTPKGEPLTPRGEVSTPRQNSTFGSLFSTGSETDHLLRFNREEKSRHDSGVFSRERRSANLTDEDERMFLSNDVEHGDHPFAKSPLSVSSELTIESGEGSSSKGEKRESGSQTGYVDDNTDDELDDRIRSNHASQSLAISLVRSTGVAVDTGSGLNPGSMENCDWNERFQKCMEEINDITALTSALEKERIYAQLSDLADDFDSVALTYAKILVQEKNLPVSRKTIKPDLSLGGQLGGEKYCVNSIIFKFAVSRGMFQRSGGKDDDEAAAKVAGHDLKGLESYFSLNLAAAHRLYFPLMTLVDYLGYRVICVSRLPIDASTQVYGSMDAGRTIRFCDEALSNSLKQCAQSLLLKAHSPHTKATVDVQHKPQHVTHALSAAEPVLFSAADLEGHIGFDGRRYLLDFSRTWPPERPNKSFFKGHLFRMLRGELVRTNRTELNPDAFSSFSSDLKSDEEDIVTATERLHNDAIPTFAAELSSVSEDSFRTYLLIHNIHRKGINLRHLGSIRAHCTVPFWRGVLLLEMLVRAVKCDVRQKWRDSFSSRSNPPGGASIRNISMQAAKHIGVDALNVVLGQGPKSDTFWTETAKDMLVGKFGDVCLGNGERRGDYDLRESLYGLPLPDSGSFQGAPHRNGRVRRQDGLSFAPILFDKLTDTLGLEFQSRERFLLNSLAFNFPEPLDVIDLVKLQIRRKNTKIVTMAQGYILKTKFSRNEQRVQLRDLAIDKFEAALRSMPVLRPVYLVNLADLYRKAGRVADANEFYLHAMKSDPSDPSSLLKYAHFLAEQGNDALASDYYQRALQLDPNFVGCLWDYSMFLCEDGTEDAIREADRLLLRAVEVVRESPEFGFRTHSAVLHDYAIFCVRFLQDNDRAETYFASAIRTDPSVELHRQNYKLFLENVRVDGARAAEIGAGLP